MNTSKNQIQNDLGTISFHPNVMDSLVKTAAATCFAEQGKDKNDVRGLELIEGRDTRVTELEEGGIDIDLYVEMAYGALVPQIMPALHSSLRQNIRQYADLQVRDINVHVERISLLNRE